MHDLIIRNAQIVDGTGNPAQWGDVAVDGGQITELGTGLGGGVEEVNADGLTLAPGIIDLHTHYDAQLTWDSSASPSTGLGVTTALIGNCGFTIAPCKPGAIWRRMIRRLRDRRARRFRRCTTWVV